METLPWDQINAVLLDVGAATTREELFARLLAGVGEVIPWDTGIGIFGRDIRCHEARGWDRRTFSQYNEHYHRTVPFIHYASDGRALKGQDVVHWNHVEECEFTRDFAGPLRLHSGLSPFRPAWALNLSIQRSRDYPTFTQHDCRILDIFNAHLQNYLRLIDASAPEPLGTSNPTLSTASAREAIRRCYRLSEREMEVLSCLHDGLPNRAIAANLFISERTVKAHLVSVFRKLDVSSRTRAIALTRRGF